MPDKNNTPLSLWSKVTICCPDIVNPHHEYHDQRGTIVRLIPGWDAEIKFDNPAIENHIIEGRELIIG